MSHKQCVSVLSGHNANCIQFVCSEQQICVQLRKTKASLRSTDLVERSAQLDKWHGRERPLGIHLQVAGPEAVEIAHDNQKVRRRLHRQEPTPRNVHTCQSMTNHIIHTCPSTTISFSISHQLQQIHLSLAPDVTMIYVYISVSCNGTGGLSRTQQHLWLDVSKDATNDFLSCSPALVSASAPQDVYCGKNIV